MIDKEFANHFAIDWVGGCKNFCVNGHLAGNCRPVRKEL